MIRNLIKGITVLLLGLLLIECTSDTKHHKTSTTIKLDQGKLLTVTKKSSTTTHIGIISKTNYGDTYRYQYEFKIPQEKIHWSGGSSVPMHLLTTKDSVYLHLYKNKYIPAKDSTQSGREIVEEVFEVFVDDRYFFKLFGNTYWSSISADHYANQKENGKEYQIPNDGELTLSPALQ